MKLPATCVTAPGESNTGTKMSRFLEYVESFDQNHASPRMRVYPGLRSTPWHDPSLFPIVANLEREFEGIRREILALNGPDFQPESENIRRTGSWDVSFFYELGKKNVENCARCPLIMTIVETHNTIRSLAGLIYVSRMSPGTHIAPHQASTNMRVRCHLAIQVPPGDCALQVGGETRPWIEGKCSVFDDHFRHEAWNYTSGERIVLIVDLWNPDLSPKEIALLEGMHRYASAYARHLNRYWSTNEEARHVARMAERNEM
jgi:aspartate beta-hydroxylase